jgi:hypothetical protein
MHAFVRLSVAIALTAVSLSLAARKESELPEFTEDGLQLRQGSKLAIVYAEPGAELSAYRRVQLLDAYVAFKKGWEKEQRRSTTQSTRISSKDIERIRTDLAAGFHEEFSTRLQKAGFPVVDEAGEDVLLVRPAIIDLDVNAPATMSAGNTRTYVASAGEMTLYVELYDSLTGDLIAKALDRRVDSQHRAYYTWANRATNRAAADRILQGWADILVNALTAAQTSDGDGTAMAGEESE